MFAVCNEEEKMSLEIRCDLLEAALQEHLRIFSWSGDWAKHKRRTKAISSERL
jgi:hypothetical protein